MEFKQEGIRITVPDKITVRQQMAYFSIVTGIEEEKKIERRWAGAKYLIDEWECKLIPDKDKANLDKLYRLEETSILIWVGNQVIDHMNSLEETPKN